MLPRCGGSHDPQPRFRSKLLPGLLGAAVLGLGGCEQSVTIDLAVSGTDAIEGAVLPLSAVQLLRDSGALTSVRVTTQAGDLLALAPDDTVQLVSGAEVPEGSYTGLALAFDVADASVTRPSDAAAAVSISSAELFADPALDVQAGTSAHRLVVLDLRFSLSDQTATLGSYYLRPYYRVVNLDAQGAFAGAATTAFVESAACRSGRNAGQGVAVYAYRGTGIEPGDFVAGYTGASIPVASAVVALDSASSSYRYRLPYLAPGEYTLAITCQGDQEDPLADQDLAFQGARSTTITAGATIVADFP
ncbi:MAG TPA: DUF4382 domain-containing protein [Solimonas sp.]|nr:DUF4382 domain-containing protein [Solimonas sp.]